MMRWVGEIDGVRWMGEWRKGPGGGRLGGHCFDEGVGEVKGVEEGMEKRRQGLL